MRSAPALRSAMLLAVPLLLGSCDALTQPEPPIPLTEAANDFFVTLSGARTGNFSGGALHRPADVGSGRVVTLLSSPNDSIRIVFQPGVLSSSSYAFPLGKQKVDEFVGLHPLDVTIWLLYNGQSYVATSGSVEVVESSSTKIRARFDVTGSSLASGRSVRARGTFWSVPDPAP